MAFSGPEPVGQVIMNIGSDEVFFEGECVVIHAAEPMDWPIREFCKVPIWFQGRKYYLRSKRNAEQPGPIVYELWPWPADLHDASPHAVVYDEAYAIERDKAAAKGRRHEWLYLALLPLYPFLGLLWSGFKSRALGPLGFEPTSITKASIVLTFNLFIVEGIFVGWLAGGILTYFRGGLRFGPWIGCSCFCSVQTRRCASGSRSRWTSSSIGVFANGYGRERDRGTSDAQPERIITMQATATWTDRLVGIIIDLIVLWLLAQVLPFTVLYYKILPNDLTSRPLEILSGAETYLLAPAYFVLLRAYWNGQTLGKRVLGLKVVSLDGGPLKLWQAVVDPLGYLVWPVDFLVGILFSKNGDQRMTQIFAGTAVVKV
jgi:uncharacterized RDD family membrane protein YckC